MGFDVRREMNVLDQQKQDAFALLGDGGEAMSAEIDVTFEDLAIFNALTYLPKALITHIFKLTSYYYGNYYSIDANYQPYHLY